MTAGQEHLGAFEAIRRCRFVAGVLVQWMWAYLTFWRGTRLITGG